MNLEGLTLHILTNELQKELLGSKIYRVLKKLMVQLIWIFQLISQVIFTLLLNGQALGLFLKNNFIFRGLFAPVCLNYI